MALSGTEMDGRASGERDGYGCGALETCTTSLTKHEESLLSVLVIGLFIVSLCLFLK